MFQQQCIIVRNACLASALDARLAAISMVTNACNAKIVICESCKGCDGIFASWPNVPKMMHQMKVVQVIKNYICGLWLLLLLDSC